MTTFDGATQNYTHQNHRLPIYFLEIFTNLFKFKILKIPFQTSNFTKTSVMNTLQFERPLTPQRHIFMPYFIRLFKYFRHHLDSSNFFCLERAFTPVHNWLYLGLKIHYHIELKYQNHLIILWYNIYRGCPYG